MWIASLARHGRLLAQRVCFIQTKVVRKGTAKGIDAGQLELLSTFPGFSFPKNARWRGDVTLSNRSGMLSAYGFMEVTGEMPLLAAQHLRNVCAGYKSRSMKLIGPVIASLDTSYPGTWRMPPIPWPCLPFLHDPHCRRLLERTMFEYWEPWLDRMVPAGLWPMARDALMFLFTQHVLGQESVLAAASTRRAIQAWIGLRLGELWTPEEAWTVPSVRALAGAVYVLAHRAKLSALEALLRRTEVVGRDVEPVIRGWYRDMLVVALQIDLSEENLEG